MITNSRVSQYSPNSEESDEQPLDFSKNSISASALTSINIKRESNGRVGHSTQSPELRQSPQQPPANCFTTPSPSPPEHNPNSHHTNQVLCQLLTGNLIPTSTGKLMSATAGKNVVNPLSVQNDAPGIRLNGLRGQSPVPLSTTSPTNPSVLQAFNERRNSSISPTGSVSPIGLGPLNQVEMHFAQSPNASGVDRFGTSGGLLTTAPNVGMFSTNDSAKRALKYSRPFKAYPRDPLSIPMSYYGVGLQMPLNADAIATQSLLATASDQAYLQFREQMLVTRSKSSNGQQEPRRNGQQSGPQSVPKNSSPTPDIIDSNSNGNNNMINTQNNSNNGNTSQIIYSSRSLSPSSHSLAAKLNGSMAAMTPISSSSRINSDETLDYSNGNSSGNSSSGEADVRSLNSTTGPNSGRHSDGHQSMRKRGRPLPEDLKDDAYWERRRKNNEAAKRSRDARRAKEDEIAIRAAFLEQENLKLRCEIAQLKTETTKLRCLLYNS